MKTTNAIIKLKLWPFPPSYQIQTKLNDDIRETIKYLYGIFQQRVLVDRLTSWKLRYVKTGNDKL